MSGTAALQHPKWSSSTIGSSRFAAMTPSVVGVAAGVDKGKDAKKDETLWDNRRRVQLQDSTAGSVRPLRHAARLKAPMPQHPDLCPNVCA